MARFETSDHPETERTPAYDLVVIPGGEAYGTRRPAPPRPDSGFLTQLLLGANPVLRPTRLDRTRNAAATYAAMARQTA
ncbi:hypothetical protein [Methylobacterium gossipiicola]|uniref:Uncharacterized protein n=1 Tax=Methylobacterium gossipiicola TaxID=582675 RepID=A0A1I2U7Q8_9HYPH|nr:hypothetical protein [Methylobacterium gossipiicola]SFG73164.1 hypothetical protein SAMN05192565_10968 [Methylobacterium gossipiicola]